MREAHVGGVHGLGSRIEGLGFGVSGKGSRVNLGLLRQAFEGLQGLCRVVLDYMIWVVVKIMVPFWDPYYNTAPNI